jgi:exopolyphosphatase/guanosine-5'-triphosphate,3'-diphosphate pyrophosphatase
MNHKFAIIDMGTNTFHLLLAQADDEGDFEITYRDRVAAKIGKDGINQGRITSEGIKRALKAMQGFQKIISEHRIGDVYAFGTSALRSSTNQAEVLEEIKALTGIVVQVISGDVEAEYIYKGVRFALDLGSEKNLIVDIGGGSVEFIIANRSDIFWKTSLEIGAQRLLELFHRNDPITPEELSSLDRYFDEKLHPLFDALKNHPTKVLIGASGTFDTLSDIFCHRESIIKEDEDPETPLTLNGFYHIYEQLITKTRTERMKIPGMIEMRVDMIVVACCLIRYILSRHPFNHIRVSSYSLKEGVLASLAQTVRSADMTGS